MKYLSVCSGIEAATVAWHPLGWEPVAFAEIDPFASALLAHHYPDTPNLGDMTAYENWPIKRGAIDVLVGGTPCQSFSVAGLRRGLADPRGNLALTYLGILDRLRPRWCVWENVPGVLSSNGGRDFGAFLGALGQLGYGFAYRVLDSQYVRVESHPRAVPQRRRRVFVVGHLGDWRRAAKVLFEPEGVRGDRPPRREPGKGFAGGADGGVTSGGTAGVASTLRQRRPGESGFSTDVDSVVIGWRAGDQANAEVMIDAAGTLNCNDGQRGGFIWPQEAADPITAHEGKTYTHEGKVFRTRNVVPSLRYPEVPDVCGTVADGAHHGGGLNGQDAYTGRILPVIAEGVDPYNGTTTGDVAIGLRVGDMSVGSLPAVLTPEASPALTAAYARGTGARADSGVTRCVVNDRASMVVRRLTPRECERLQGFPDDYTLVPHRGKPAADGNRYKALGNSMAVNVMRWIGERIALSERAHRETHAIDCDLDEDCMCAASTW